MNALPFSASVSPLQSEVRLGWRWDTGSPGGWGKQPWLGCWSRPRCRESHDGQFQTRNKMRLNTEAEWRRAPSPHARGSRRRASPLGPAPGPPPAPGHLRASSAVCPLPPHTRQRPRAYGSSSLPVNKRRRSGTWAPWILSLSEELPAHAPPSINSAALLWTEAAPPLCGSCASEGTATPRSLLFLWQPWAPRTSPSVQAWWGALSLALPLP